MQDIEIFPGITTVDGFRTIFIKRLSSVVISDLQLGHELYLAEEEGIFIPQTQLKEMKKDLSKISRRTKAKILIIDGDIKHEFGEASAQEWREVFELADFLKRKFEKIILVRGNHDNYLLNIISKLGLELHDPYFLADEILLTHGHKKISYPKNFQTLIIGHEQPALALREGFTKIKVPCLLYGKTKNKKNFICLPAFSPLASGVEVNLISKEELLSPILKEEVEFYDLIPITLDRETGALRFPSLRNLIFSLHEE